MCPCPNVWGNAHVVDVEEAFPNVDRAPFVQEARDARSGATDASDVERGPTVELEITRWAAETSSQERAEERAFVAVFATCSVRTRSCSPFEEQKHAA